MTDYDWEMQERKFEYDMAAIDLEAENAELCELVRAAWRCIHTGVSCYDCRLIAGGCTLQTAMIELGVEVE